MASTLYIPPYIPAFSPVGNLVPGAKLYFYRTGTNTLAPIYSNANLTTQMSNPVTADLAARFPTIYLDASITYRVKVTDPAGVSIGADIDPYAPGIGGTGGTVTKDSIGLGNVDNTSDLNKPVSTATQAAINAVSGSTVSVLKYIPLNLQSDIAGGNSTVDVSSYVQQVYNETKAQTVFWPAGKYVIGTEIDTKGRSSIGVGPYLTILVGGTLGQRSVLLLGGYKSTISRMTVDGGSNANHCIYAIGANSGRVELCLIQNGRIGGVTPGNTGNNSELAIRDNLIKNNGRRFASGTGTGNAGAGSVTISGVDPTTLGIRTGSDFIKIDGEPMREIVAVSSNSISFYGTLNANRSGANVQIYQGSGLEIQNNGDNSDIKSQNNTYQNNAVFGIDCQALYGVQSEGDTAEFNSMGVGIGRRFPEKQVINWSVDGLYSEANGEGAHIYHGSSREGHVENPVLDGISNNGLDFMYVADYNTLRTFTMVNVEGVTGSRRSFSINSGDTSMNLGSSGIFAQSAGSGDFTVTLGHPTLGSNGASLATNVDVVTTVVLGDIGGRTCTIRSDLPINGAAVSGSYSTKAFTGNWRKIEARFMGAGGFVVTATPTP